MQWTGRYWSVLFWWKHCVIDGFVGDMMMMNGLRGWKDDIKVGYICDSMVVKLVTWVTKWYQSGFSRLYDDDNVGHLGYKIIF